MAAAALVAAQGLVHAGISRLNAALNAAPSDPAAAGRITSRGDELGGGTPGRLATRLTANHRLWGDVVGANTIRAAG